VELVIAPWTFRELSGKEAGIINYCGLLYTSNGNLFSCFTYDERESARRLPFLLVSFVFLGFMRKRILILLCVFYLNHFLKLLFLE